MSTTSASSLLPFPRHEFFVGRDSDLRALEKWLYESNMHRRMSIYGPEGCGKTMLALEFAYQVLTKCSKCLVFWVPAYTRDSFELAYREIGISLRIPGITNDNADVKHLVKNELNLGSFNNWLMIVDNADDDTSLFFNYLPQSDRGSILFTTRNRGTALGLSNINILKLDGMIKIEEARQLINLQISNKDLLNDNDTIDELLNMLTYSPLAITLVVAFINRNSISISEFVSSYKNSGAEIFKKHIEDPNRSTDMENALHILFERIRKQDQLAANYLSFIACIYHTNIPLSLLPIEGSTLQRSKAIGILTGYAFIRERRQDLQEGEKFFDVHSLVQIALKAWLEKHGELSNWNKKVYSRLEDVLPYGGHKERNIWVKYIPHAIVVAEPQNCPDKIARASLLNRIGQYQLTLGQYSAAEAMHRQSLNLKREMLGEQHSDTLTSMSNLACVLNIQGKYEEAEAIERQTLALKIKILGKEHPDTLTSMNNLAWILNNQGKHEEAEAISRQTLQLRIKVLGKQHPDTLTSMSNVASILYRQGKHEAEELNRRITTVDGTDETGSLSSFSSGSSIASTSSSQTDTSFLASNVDKAKNAAQYFAALLFQDPELRDFYQKGFKEFDAADFMTKHDGLLKLFFKNIRRECQNPVQVHVLRLLRVRSQRYEIFSTIRKNFTPNYTVNEQAFIDLQNQKPERMDLLEESLSYAHTIVGDSAVEHEVGKQSISQSLDQDKETSDEDQGSNNSDSYELHPNLGRVVEFLIKGKSFAEFRSNLSSLLRPRETAEKSPQSVQVIGKSASESYSEPLLQGSGSPEETTREDWEPSSDSVKCVTMDRDNRASPLNLSFVTDLQEINSKRRRGWKFFIRFAIFCIGRSFRPCLKSNYSRLEWVCECGTPLYDDFEGSIEALQKLASDLKGKVTSGPAAVFMTAQAESNQSRGYLNLPEGALSDHMQARPGMASSSFAETTGQSESPTNIIHNSTQTAVGVSSDNYRWLEICIQSGGKLHVLEEIDTKHNPTDREVFLKIRQRYETLNKSRMRQSCPKWLKIPPWLSLRKASGPNFIGFCLNTVGFTSKDPTTVVIVNDHPAYPDEELVFNGHYSFKLAHGETPISTRAFNHFLHYAENEAHNAPFWILRFPHLLDDSLLRCRVPQKKAWGIELTERWNWTSFCALNAFGLSLSAMIAALVWVFTRDSQTGVAIGTWCSTIQALVITAVFFEWSNL